MKPIMLNGHTRALTQIKYNAEGDLLFSCAKDSIPSVWYSHNGERLGTYNGHTGTVWTLDMDYTTTMLATGSADNSARIWDAETGQCKVFLETQSAVRTLGFSYDASRLFMSTDATMGNLCEMRIFSVSALKQEGSRAQPLTSITIPKGEAKMTSAVWGPLDKTIIAGHENGELRQYDAVTGEMLRRERPHQANFNDIQYSKDMSMFITASKDMTAKVFDTQSFEILKTYKTERPVNSAAISPLREHVLLAGGQDAMSVTQTAGKAGKFEARFFHLVFEEELGRVKGHFGPINTVAFHPSGRGYSSGGEDGYIRIHEFDPSYFEFEFEH